MEEGKGKEEGLKGERRGRGKEGVMRESALFPSYFNRVRTTKTPA